jgi:hypothetical protein
MTDVCYRCGSPGPLVLLQGKQYCRPCCELSFRSLPRYRRLERRDPQREPRGFGRRWTDILVSGKSDS